MITLHIIRGIKATWYYLTRCRDPRNTRISIILLLSVVLQVVCMVILLSNCHPAPPVTKHPPVLDKDPPFEIRFGRSKLGEPPPDIVAHYKAASYLNKLAGVACFRIVDEPYWRYGSPPTNVIVSSVNSDKVKEYMKDPDGHTAGLINILRSGGAHVYVLPEFRSDQWVLAHELLHYALGTSWGEDSHDREGLLAPTIPSGKVWLPEPTIIVLKAICRS